MSTIIGQTIIYDLEEAINRQEQTKLLLEMLSLCKRVISCFGIKPV
jgi:hypothetical protein